MEKLTFKTIGSAPSKVVEFTAKKLADELQENISGRPANELQADQLTQEFVDRHDIIAKYSSGTFMGFKNHLGAALDEFETFKKK